MLRKVWAWLTGGELIEVYCPFNVNTKKGYTRDEVAAPIWRKTIKYKLADGREVAKVYWYNGVGGVVLNPDGNIAPDSDAYYATKWRKG